MFLTVTVNRSVCSTVFVVMEDTHVIVSGLLFGSWDVVRLIQFDIVAKLMLNIQHISAFLKEIIALLCHLLCKM